MKILHINTYDRGGAAKACIRLHLGLLEEGVDSKLLVFNQFDKSLKNSFQYLPPIPDSSEKIKHKAKQILRELYLYPRKDKYDRREILKNRPEGLEIFSFPDTPYDITQHPLYLEADVINLHWTTGFLDYTSFFKNNSKKIVWTLHDMNPFTGGCHYAGDCDGFEKNCFKCPQLLNTKDESYSKKIFQVKLKALQGKENMTIVVPSKWLLRQSQKSILFRNFSHKHIPYGLNQNIVKAVDKIYSRELLGLPLDKKIILFVSQSLGNKRKGFKFLLKAIEELNEREDVVLCTVGYPLADEFKVKNLFVLGSIADERLMSAAYSAADVFVIPSLEDNFPNTVLEALMCGTAVIGFPVGGIKEMIQSKENGYLCDSITVDSLVKSLSVFLENPLIFNHEKIRNDALERYSQKVQVSKYIELYNTILNKA